MKQEAANRMFDDREESEIDRDDKEETGSNGIAWFLTGVLIGATAAILYAPKSGKDTRHFLGDRTQRSADAVSDKTKEFTDASRELFDRGRKVVEDAADLFDRARRLVRG